TLSDVGLSDAASYDVIVANAVGRATSAVATLTVTCPSFSLVPATLPDGQLNSPYSRTVTAPGAAMPYSFTLSAGALPAGLGLSASGVVSGTPTTLSSNYFVLTATDAHGCTASQAYTVFVVCPAIAVTPSSLPAGAIGSAY